MNWKEQFKVVLRKYNISGEDEILLIFISSLLQQKDQEWKDKIEKWADDNYAIMVKKDGRKNTLKMIKSDDLINFIKQ